MVLENKQTNTEEMEASRALLNLKTTLDHFGPLSGGGRDAQGLAILRNNFEQFKALKEHLSPKESEEISMLEMKAKVYLEEKE